jgi:hypothetical protein
MISIFEKDGFMDNKKFAVEINFNHFREKIGYLVEAEDSYKADGIAQRHFLSSHPDEAVLSSHVVEITIRPTHTSGEYICLEDEIESNAFNPSKRNSS